VCMSGADSSQKPTSTAKGGVKGPSLVATSDPSGNVRRYGESHREVFSLGEGGTQCGGKSEKVNAVSGGTVDEEKSQTS